MPGRRVVILSHTAEIGGAEGALLRLLGAVDRARFEPYAIVFADGPLVARLAALGIPARVLPLGDAAAVTRSETGSPRALLAAGAGTAAFVPRLVRLLRSTGAELAVANSLKAATLLAAAAPLVPIRWAWHLHDRLADDYLPARTARALRLLARRGPRQLVVNSEAVLATVGDVGDIGAKASVAYPGLEAAAFAQPRPPLPPRLDRPLIGILGRIGATKGQHEFVRAAAEIARDRPEARFRIIGAALFRDGDYERALRAEVPELGVGAAVEFCGWSEDPAASLRALDVLVHASPVPEPFGQVVVEAMAAGVPVVATDAGGVPEILDPARTASVAADGVRRSELGILVRPGDPAALARGIGLALADPGELRAAAARAHASAAARFTIEQTARVIEGAWERALAPRSGR